jgi:heme-degrading monooxygenase HmoA
MSGAYTTAVWIAKPGAEDEFVEAWSIFAAWASSMPGAGALRLTRDLVDRNRFVSFGRWNDLEAAHAWKASPEFRVRMAAVQAHVDSFVPAELEVVRVVSDQRVA